MATETVALSTTVAHSTVLTKGTDDNVLNFTATFPAEAGICRLQVRSHDADRWFNETVVSVAASGRVGFSTVGWRWARLEMVLNSGTGDATVDRDQF